YNLGDSRDWIRPGIGLSALAVIVCMLSACTGAQNPLELALSELNRQEADEGVIDLPSRVPGEWVETIMVCSFTSNKVVDGVLGFHWAGAPLIDGNYGRDLLVFSDGNKVLRSIEIPIGLILCKSYLGGGFDGARAIARDDSILALERRTSDDDDPLYGSDGDESRWVLNADRLVISRQDGADRPPL